MMPDDRVLRIAVTPASVEGDDASLGDGAGMKIKHPALRPQPSDPKQPRNLPEWPAIRAFIMVGIIDRMNEADKASMGAGVSDFDVAALRATAQMQSVGTDALRGWVWNIHRLSSATLAMSTNVTVDDAVSVMRALQSVSGSYDTSGGLLTRYVQPTGQTTEIVQMPQNFMNSAVGELLSWIIADERRKTTLAAWARDECTVETIPKAEATMVQHAVVVDKGAQDGVGLEPMPAAATATVHAMPGHAVHAMPAHAVQTHAVAAHEPAGVWLMGADANPSGAAMAAPMSRASTSTRPKEWACTEPGCDKRYTQQSHLKAHLDSHRGKEWPCTQPGCPKVYKSQRGLSLHLERHRGKVFICDHPGCGKSFTRQSSLKVHNEAHQGIEYVCPEPSCNKKYKTQKGLSLHLDVHRGVSWTCPEPGCNKKYTRQSSLKVHLDGHRGVEYVCPEPGCDKKYKTQKGLNWHLDRHHTDPEDTPMPVVVSAALAHTVGSVGMGMGPVSDMGAVGGVGTVNGVGPTVSGVGPTVSGVGTAVSGVGTVSAVGTAVSGVGN
jgi:hypothetical protein